MSRALSAYEALIKIDQVARKRVFKPLVFICSPFAGDMEGNTQRAREYCRIAVERGAIPLAPHLLYPQFLDELNPEHRALGLFFGRVLLGKCSELWAFGDSVSRGMAAEIEKAKRRDMPIRYFNNYFEEVQAI